MNTVISIDQLTVVRGPHTVFDGFSASIDGGIVTGLLGPSGSGKTTLIRAIVGVQKVKSGTVTVLGEPAGSAPLRRRVAYMTQAASVYSDITVAENVRYFARLAGVPTARVREVIDQVGLATHTNQLAGNLSGGQLSRTSLACALVGDPEVLVLDEPTVGQDPVLREELWDHFRGLARAGATVVVSSHVMDEADRCDDLLLLRDGELISHGTPAELRAASGTTDLDDAFLALVRARSEGTPAHAPAHAVPITPPDDPRTPTRHGRHAAEEN